MRLVYSILFAVLLTTSVLASQRSLSFDPLGAVYATEVARPGDEALVQVSLANERSSLLENVRVYAYIPELALFYRTTSFDIDDDESVSRTLVIDLPLDTPRGLYLIVVGASNHDGVDFRSRTHRYILVV